MGPSDHYAKYLKYKTKYLHTKVMSGGVIDKEGKLLANPPLDYPDKQYEYVVNGASVINIERETVTNKDYRRVIHTSNNMQLVLMTLKPGVEIGMERHDSVDQFIRIEEGSAKCRYGGTFVSQGVTDTDTKEHTVVYDEKVGTVSGTVISTEFKELPKDHVLLVPRGTWHNIWNDSANDVNIYTVYSYDNGKPPHRVDVKQLTKEDEKNEVHP